MRKCVKDGVARRVGINEHCDVAFRPLRILEKRVAERFGVVDGRDQISRDAGVVGDADDNGAIDSFVDERVGRLRNGRGERLVFHEEVGDRHTEFIFRVGRKARDLAGSNGRLEGARFDPLGGSYGAVFDLNARDVVVDGDAPIEGRDGVQDRDGIFGEVFGGIGRKDVAGLRKAAKGQGVTVRRAVESGDADEVISVGDIQVRERNALLKADALAALNQFESIGALFVCFLEGKRIVSQDGAIEIEIEVAQVAFDVKAFEGIRHVDLNERVFVIRNRVVLALLEVEAEPVGEVGACFIRFARDHEVVDNALITNFAVFGLVGG